MIEFLLITIGLIGLLIASFCDIETREVPNWLNFSLIASGLGVRTIGSLNQLNLFVIISGLIGVFSMIIIGTALYYTKQWGGGDTKLLIGIGALFGSLSFSRWFLVHFFINLILIGSIYGLAWSIYLAIKHHKHFVKIFKVEIPAHKKKLKMFLPVAILLFLMSFLIEQAVISLMLALSGGLVLFYVITIIFVKTVEDACMFRSIKIKHLTEGDWIAQDVFSGKKKIYSTADPGVSRTQISLMRKLRLNRVLIKEGIPFVPSFLFTMLVTLIMGNVFSVLI